VANPQVEMLKALGLRHGEKAVVGISATLCVVFLVLAGMKETIQITPNEVDSHASDARKNLERHQDPDKIIAKIEAEGIKNPGFEKVVDAQAKETLSPDNFKAARLWVTNEPGAGMIRDRPVIVAPAELYAYPGRGGAAVFALDEEGNRIKLKEGEGKLDEAVVKRRKTRRVRTGGQMAGGGMGGMGGMGGSGMGRRGGRGGMGGMAGMMGGMGTKKEMTEKEKKEFERKQQALKNLLAGNKKGDEDEATKDEAEKEGTNKEVTKGLRWVVITGVLDNKKMKENWLNALKIASVAYPHFKQLDVQRQVRNDDGTWPEEWENVDGAKNQAISDNLPETEEELAPDDVLLRALVDPLPFLKAGYWERVHVVSLVPKSKRELEKPAGGMMGGPGMMMGGRGGMGMMGSEGMMGGQGGMGMAMGGRGGMGMMGSEGMMGGRGMGMGMGGFGGMGGGSSVETVDWEKSEAKTLMIRSIDYTVEPDTTYRFRLRVVVYNPNLLREDVSPGTDNKNETLEGPWSEPTEAVTMPADVTPYAVDKEPATIKRGDQVSFQVARWNPEDGVTVTKTFAAGPGEIIGDVGSAQIPSSDGKAAKSKAVDFISRQLVLDSSGGSASIERLGASSGSIDVPVLSLLMRPDGSVVIRNEAQDKPDPVRRDIAANYKRELEESVAGKHRENSMGGMMGGMMGPGGMMMGGR
jgi:hypothetical protein